MRLPPSSTRSLLYQTYPLLRRTPKCSPLARNCRWYSSTNVKKLGGLVTDKLTQLTDSGEIRADEHQLQAAQELDRIYDDLMKNDPPPLLTKSADSSSNSSSSSSSSSLFGSLFGDPVESVTRILTPSTRGAYMYGGVGCGKTFLMNLLHEAVDSGPWAQEKHKVHYHQFMLDVQQQMHQVRKTNPQADLIPPVVDRILEKGRFLCLDEFQVTDVADALILQRLFTGLWDSGCVLVTTSNRPPQDLYKNGLQRDRFLPFIDLLQEQCALVNLMESSTDYRMVTSFGNLSDTESDNDDDDKALNPPHPHHYSVYFANGQKKKFQKLFHKLTKGFPLNPTSLQTQGRKVPIPLACPSKKIAEFSFDDLCRKALGAADYIVIGQQFSTVFCHSIPKLTIHHINWLRRFITFVDTMYELKVHLVLHTTSASIDDVFVIDDNKDEYSQDEVFAFDRTRSRLEEMASDKYLSGKWLGGDATDETATLSLNVVPSPADVKIK